MSYFIKSSILTVFTLIQSPLHADESFTSKDRLATSMTKLKNGIPIIIRETVGSDIVHLEVDFKNGSAHVDTDKRVISLLTMEAMTSATTKYSKSKIFALTEKYSTGVDCNAGVESSVCGFTTVNEYLPQMIDLLGSVIKDPIFTNEDVDLVRKQKIAAFQQDIQNPEAYVNSLVNSVFYEKNHPFRLLPEDGIRQAKTATPQELKHHHKKILDASLMAIVYVGPKPSKSFFDQLEKTIGTIPNKDTKHQAIPAPKFDPKNAFAFENRPIPTAYIRIKFNAPSAHSPEAATTEVLFEMLDNKLHEEIRTKRSLSYSINAANIAYSQGIGVLVASTSKPKETLETIASVIKSFREKAPAQSDVDEHRNIFTTSYYATMESQSQLAGALFGAWYYHQDPNALYDTQSKLERVTPQDILKLSQSILKEFRIGVVYDQSKFQNEWIEPITKL